MKGLMWFIPAFFLVVVIFKTTRQVQQVLKNKVWYIYIRVLLCTLPVHAMHCGYANVWQQYVTHAVARQE